MDTFISIKPENLQELEQNCKEFNISILDIEKSKDSVIWIKIKAPTALGNLYLLGLRMGGLMAIENSFNL